MAITQRLQPILAGIGIGHQTRMLADVGHRHHGLVAIPD
jgi:hypothetical protein